MKGIILAGGNGTRLLPVTLGVSKQMLLVYDKPMIYYSLSSLMKAGIREILIISTPIHTPAFQALLGDGSQLGMKFEYKVQEKPVGLADAFIVGEEFIGNEKVALILGDNMMYGSKIEEKLQKGRDLKEGGVIFGYKVENPTWYGVAEIDEDGKVISLEEKPKNPKSNLAVPGIYFYDNDVIKIAKTIKPSDRGELEITDINKEYMKNGKLKLIQFDNECIWFDMGSIERLSEASNFVKALESNNETQVACIEEIAYKNKWISKEQLLEQAYRFRATSYGKYLKKIAEEN